MNSKWIGPLLGGLLFCATPAWAFEADDLRRLITERSCRNCDLSGADLGGLDLSQGDFSGADFTFANLQETDFSGANLKGVLFGYNFFMPKPSRQGKQEILTEWSLRRSLRQGDTWQEAAADLGLWLWDTSYLKAVMYKGTQMSGARFVGANLEGADLTACNLKGARFDQAHLKGADFSYARLVEAQFKEAYAPQAVFYKADLSGAGFDQADLEGALLFKAVYQSAQTLPMFRGARLGGAISQEGKLCKEGSLGRCN